MQKNKKNPCLSDILGVDQLIDRDLKALPLDTRDRGVWLVAGNGIAAIVRHSGWMYDLWWRVHIYYAAQLICTS